MIDEKCIGCGAKLDVAMATHRSYKLPGPFPSNILVANVTCPMCSRDHVVAQNFERPASTAMWPLANEMLESPRDMTWVSENPDRKMVGRLPLFISWLWTPVTGDKKFLKQLLNAVKADEDFQIGRAHV